MKDENEEFLDLLSDEPYQPAWPKGKTSSEAAAPVSESLPTYTSGNTCQWSILGDDRFRATGATTPKLPPGLYRIDEDQWGIYFSLTKPAIDTLIRLPDSAGDRVIAGIQAFWRSKEKFQTRGHVFKRGVLLWGPPGGGKTATVNLLSADLIKSGGMVLWIQSPTQAIQALTALRRIEPDRAIIAILEDLDELASRWSEHEILSLLDGENQVDNVVFVATTNYPERLDGRMINRPSRFDEIIKIGMPTPEARSVYIRSRLNENEMSEAVLRQWTEDTSEFSIAHLKEMIVAVYCLDRDYADTLKRLRAMIRRRPTSVRDGREMGLLAAVGE